MFKTLKNTKKGKYENLSLSERHKIGQYGSIQLLIATMQCYASLYQDLKGSTVSHYPDLYLKETK